MKIKLLIMMLSACSAHASGNKIFANTLKEIEQEMLRPAQNIASPSQNITSRASWSLPFSSQENQDAPTDGIYTNLMTELAHTEASIDTPQNVIALRQVEADYMALSAIRVPSQQTIDQIIAQSFIHADAIEKTLMRILSTNTIPITAQTNAPPQTTESNP